MAEVLQALFVDPPIAVARLGASDVPQHAFAWSQSPNTRTLGETGVVPAWTLGVLPDGSVEPFLPNELRFRDGGQIRPVCPFFEVWALVGQERSAPGTWQAEPVTPSLLRRFEARPSNLRITVDARNLKAARRTNNPDLAFGTFPPVEIRGDLHLPVALVGTSPPAAAHPMIPRGRHIPFGSVQVLRPRRQHAGMTWGDAVNLETMRFRFTPAKGRFFGPPGSERTTTDRPFPSVPPEDAFLDPGAGWFGAPPSPNVQPFDTYAGAENESEGRPSLGIVDDTCEARITVSLTLPGSDSSLLAACTVFVGPPDYGPDRRPFLSLADEINDRSGDARARSDRMEEAELETWVEDLFERALETVSLLNVDWYRNRRAVELPLERRGPPLAGDGLPEPSRAAGGEDPLRDPLQRVGASTPNQPLPLSEHARTRHRDLSDLQSLRAFVRRSPGRMEQLVRRAFEVEHLAAQSATEAVRARQDESGARTTMRMPPFMRNSNAQPLTLASWQYQLLMRWVTSVEGAVAVAGVLGLPGAAAARGDLTADADERRAAVLARLGAAPDA